MSRITASRWPASLVLGGVLAAALVGPGLSPAGAIASTPQPVTARASVTAAGAEATGGKSEEPDISKDGRWVVFSSTAQNLVPGFNPTHRNVYRRDLVTGAVELVSVPQAGGGVEGNDDSSWPKVSDDGRFVVFQSVADNLAPGDASTYSDVYRRDLATHTTRLISRIPGGAGASLISGYPDISGDGSRVVFHSDAYNLASPDVLYHFDVFLWTTADTLTRLSEKPGGGEANADSAYPVISRDGTTVAYSSYATDLVAGGSSPKSDVFVRPVGGVTSRISVPTSGLLATSGCFAPQISDDGTRVGFSSAASNLVANDSNAKFDAFVRDRTTSVTKRVSTDAFGGQLSQNSELDALSSNGTLVAFRTTDNDVSLPPTTGQFHLYVRDTVAATVRAIDLRDAGGYGTGDVTHAAMSGTGRYVAFDSVAPDLVRNDANGVSDVFVRDQSTSIAPFASWDALIDQQYVDFLARPASAAEIATWKARITNGESTVGRFIDTLAHGPAWSAKRGPLLRLYWAFFLREPDAGGLSHWLGKYESGTPLASIAGSFATSKEFKDTYGPLVDAEFVKLVYGNVLQRKSEASGVAYWVDQLQHHGLTRGAMMGKFSESPEGRHVLSPYVDVLLLHLGLLRALPTKVQFEADAFGMMTDAHPAPDLAETLRLGGAYASRFP